MIIIKHKLISTEITLNIDAPTVLVIENPDMLVSFVYQLMASLEGVTDDISIIDGNKLYKDTCKISLITSLFNVDFNNKKIQNALLKKISATLSHNIYPLNQLFCQAASLIQQAVEALDANVTINPDIELTAFLKCFAPTIDCSNTSMLEMLANYVNIYIEFFDLRYLIIVGLQGFMSQQDILNLHKHCQDREVALMLIEPFHKYKLPNENCLVIDSDLCEIIE